MSEKYILRARRNDRIARIVITTGGIAIIVTVILILALVVEVAIPLFLPATSSHVAQVSLPQPLQHEDVIDFELDEYLDAGAVITRDGRCIFFDLRSGETLHEVDFTADSGPREAVACNRFGDQKLSILWDNGEISLATVQFKVVFDSAGNRSVEFSAAVRETISAGVEAESIRDAQARYSEEGLTTRVDLLTDNTFRVEQRLISTDFLGNETAEAHESVIVDIPAPVSAFVLDTDGEWLYAGTEDGRLLRWSLGSLGSPSLFGAHKASDGGAAITALNLVYGDASIAVGDADGRLSTWFPIRKTPESTTKQLARIHDLQSHSSPVKTILTSQRNKSLVTIGDSGSIHLDYPTSEQHLLNITSPSPVMHAAYALRANGVAVIGGDNSVTLWSINNPHPEISFKTLFGKVWYEGYDQPEYTWQSSASTDDFEAKISLTPLLFGSIKGTFYAMLYAVPLALFGAVYTSHFAQARIRNTIKSTVEVMAAIPSVVIGFLAALWLAPIIEEWIVSFLIGIAIVPLLVVLFVLLIQPLRQTAFFKRVEQGYEFVLMVPVICVACWLAYLVSAPLETALFGSDFKQWLYESAGERYDQRNCIVIAFALGFAVIPIIFTIAEDSLSNVPNSLKAASQALGASRWQTVWRVVLPSASPGIFAGIIIGFGRAVGETMIVLMATGNTPLLDWSIFNGMRTLSANIAVEIPEAPHGGTLYRVLFLSAVILLVFTSILNTVAELIRQRLRNKYGLNS